MRLAAIALALLLCGCARFSVNQKDISTDDSTGTNVITRSITTEIKGTAWFSSVQNISKLKAQQTDKTQSFGTDSIGQQGATNTVAVIEALARLAGALPK